MNSELEAQKAGDTATLKEGAQLATGKEYREQIGVAARRVDRGSRPSSRWGSSRTSASSTRRSPGSPTDHPNYQKYEHSKDAAYNAVVLRVATGEHDKAIANGNRFLAQHAIITDADEVVFQMGKAHQNAGRNKEAAESSIAVPRALEEPGPSRAGLRAPRRTALVKTGDEKNADDALKAAVDIGKHRRVDLGPDGKYAAAHARYMEGERVLASASTRSRYRGAT